MNDKRIFSDLNIFLYLLSSKDERKKHLAAQVLELRPFISAQVVFENLNVATKKFGLSRSEAIAHAETLLRLCPLLLDDEPTLRKAFEVLQRHQVQVFDSRILASALMSNCEILYSEDFQHNQIFEGTLTVVNPFLV